MLNEVMLTEASLEPPSINRIPPSIIEAATGGDL